MAISITPNNTWSSCFASRSGGSTAIKTDGSIWSWGNNPYNQLGIDINSPYYLNIDLPNVGGYTKTKLISYFFDKNVSKFSAGSSFSSAIKSDGTMWTWGRNHYGQLGLGDKIHRYSPVQVGTLSWTSVNSGSFSSSSIRSDGTLWVWGSNYYGELGQGDRIYRSSPVQVAGSWISVSLRNSHLLAIKADGTLWAWGFNNRGQLGLSDLANRSLPIQIGTSSWTSVYTGLNSSFAIKPDGTLWSWGWNYAGQLGQGDKIHRSSPVQVGGSWSSLSAFYHTIAIRSNGTLWAWGYNNSGQLGQGDLIYRSSPVQVGTSSWSFVSSGNTHSLAIKLDGSLWSWGFNGYGQLGQGDLIDRSSPVQVGVNKYNVFDSDGIFFSGTDNLSGILNYSGDGNYISEIGLDNIIDLTKGNYFKKTINTSDNVNFRIINRVKNKSCSFSIFLYRYSDASINFDFDIKWDNNSRPTFIRSTGNLIRDKISFSTFDNDNLFGIIEYINLG